MNGCNIGYPYYQQSPIILPRLYWNALSDEERIAKICIRLEEIAETVDGIDMDAIQEAIDNADAALTAAGAAQATASAAQTTALAAQATANAAQTTANTAQTTANSASSSATMANATANTALQIVNTIIAPGSEDLDVQSLANATVNPAGYVRVGDDNDA